MKKKIIKDSVAPLLMLAFLCAAGLVFAACSLPTAVDGDASLQETNMALAVQVTLAAMEKEQEAQAANDSAQLTQVADSVQATLDAAQPEPTQEPTVEMQPTPTPETVVEDETAEEAEDAEPDLADFDSWMKSAEILLYEDMAGIYDTTRFVQQALDSLGLDYVDVKDAVGHFKEQLLSGGPGGEGWDLIISAKEARGLVKGEMYVYLNDALNDGSSVIIEEYELDSIVRGKIAIILSRCGVDYQDQWAGDPLEHQLLWQVDGTHPIHHQPNEGIALTNPSGYWSNAELGDFMRLTPGSDAVALWAARVNVKDTYLTAVSCLDNRLIVQTYSTHNYGKDRVVRMWENYIYNTLLARYESLQ